MLDNLFSLQDRVVVITGAAGLLGRMHADAIAAFGGIPVLLDLNLLTVESMAQALIDRYAVSSVGYAVDITLESDIQKSCQAILERYGRIDALINNAANNPKMESRNGVNFSRLENFPMDTWNADISVGLTGAFLCCKHYGTAISTNSDGGAILNIASDLGLIAPDQRLYRQPDVPDDQQPVKPVTYSVVKSGLIGLTRYIATYWPDRVRCNALCPGGVQAGQPLDFLREVNARIPMGRLAEPDEYQAAVVFLLSDASRYMNGAILPMDGGRTVW